LFGGPGSGKSWNAQLIAEQFLQQGGTLVAFQPRDEYYTLKERFDLLSVGGIHARDMDFAPTAPSVYAKGIVEHGISMVFYTTDVESEEKLIDFVSRLINYILKYQERVKRPILLILEECQEYCPLSLRGHVVPSWILSRMVKSFKDCFLQGRKLNVSAIAISQRPQEVNFTIRQLANLTFYSKFAPQDISYIDKECFKWYRERGIQVDSSSLLGLKPPRWLVIYGSEARFIDVTQPRMTKHAAVTPKLEYIAPREEHVAKTVSQLAEEIKRIMERERLEESELERSRRKIRELEKQLSVAHDRIHHLEAALEMSKKLKIEVEPVKVPVSGAPSPTAPAQLQVKLPSVVETLGSDAKQAWILLREKGPLFKVAIRSAFRWGRVRTDKAVRELMRRLVRLDGKKLYAQEPLI
jgi:hypothetical protein